MEVAQGIPRGCVRLDALIAKEKGFVRQDWKKVGMSAVRTKRAFAAIAL